MSAAQNAHRGFNPRRQLVYRLAHGPTEVVQFLPVRSPIKSSADIGAIQPEFDVILVIDHRFLVEGEPEARRWGRNSTLTIVSRTLTDPKTAFAGVMLEVSFARFRDLMATANAEGTPSRPFGRWELVAIVDNRGDCEKAVRKKPSAILRLVRRLMRRAIVLGGRSVKYPTRPPTFQSCCTLG